MKLVGILLAAGSSSRFGADKLLHPLADGTPMAVASARRLRAALPETVAVLRPGSGQLAGLLRAEGLGIVVCAQAQQGMGDSIACGVAAARDADGWLIALGDMPFVPASAVRAVVAALEAGAALAAPACRGRRGHPVGFSARFAQLLLQLRGDGGARCIVEAHAADLLQIECGDPGVLRDVDTRQDLDLAPQR